MLLGLVAATGVVLASSGNFPVRSAGIAATVCGATVV
jgi:hypothetical protein